MKDLTYCMAFFYMGDLMREDAGELVVVGCKRDKFISCDNDSRGKGKGVGADVFSGAEFYCVSIGPLRIERATRCTSAAVVAWIAASRRSAYAASPKRITLSANSNARP